MKTRLFGLMLVLSVVLVVWAPQAARADSPGTFIDNGQKLGNANSYSVALADLDGDGDQDAFVTNWNQANKVWLNDGAGQFTDSGQSLGGSASREVALGDLDGDGDFDAFVVNQRNNQTNKVWLNDGGAHFSDSGQSFGNSRSTSVALGDVDGDDDLDALVVNWRGPSQVWLNDGAGNFTDSGQSLGGLRRLGNLSVALGDLDGDGDLDAFVANGRRQTANKMWLNDGAGNFTDSGQRLGRWRSYSVALGDVDGDDDLDALVLNWGGPSKLWRNDGTGNFSDSGQSLDRTYSRSGKLADVDGDGDLDAFVTSYDRRAGNEVWLNDGTGQFTDSGQRLGRSRSLGVALADLDADGDFDAFVVNGGRDPNQVWLNQGSPPSSFTQLKVTGPNNPQIYPGDTFSVAVNMQNTHDLYGLQATCLVDPAILELESATFGDFFDPSLRLVPANQVEPSAGSWFGAISQQNPAEPLSGDGLLATLTYSALAPGTTTISCDQPAPLLSDRNGFSLPSTTLGDTITVLSFGSMNRSATNQITDTAPERNSDSTDQADQADLPSHLPACSTEDLARSRADVNDDTIINIGDFTRLTTSFNQPASADSQADINADGTINIQDLTVLGGNYGLSRCEDSYNLVIKKIRLFRNLLPK